MKICIFIFTYVSKHVSYLRMYLNMSLPMCIGICIHPATTSLYLQKQPLAMVSTYNYIDIHINILVFTDVSEFVFIYVHSHLHLVSMGWLRLLGSLKLQVSFAKEPDKRDAILQKRPII